MRGIARWAWSSVLLGLATFGSALGAQATGAGASLALPTLKAPVAIDGTMTAPIWQQAAVAHLGYDYHTLSPATEDTTAYLFTDGTSLYVAFKATQTRTPILTTQHTNNVGQDTDDEVSVTLWPNGRAGFVYQFISTPIGTRYQNSTENLVYEPQWDAVGHVDGATYTVTMRIPLAVIHGNGRNKWLIQLSRFEPATSSLYVYNGGPMMRGGRDPLFALPLIGMPAAAQSRPPARFGAYALGAVAAPAAGGPTSRAGLDFSVPITNGTSLVGTLHPDFSNVESDQQNISPTAFAKYYQETRPFFTQGANAYDYMSCDECVSVQNLYTPDIPTPRDGYAIEGNQDDYLFGGFDAVGTNGRNDDAQGIVYRTEPRTFFYSFTRVNVTMPGFTDTSELAAMRWGDAKHILGFVNLGDDSGTDVTNPADARMEMIGGAWYGPNTFAGGNVIKMGSQYDPYDGFVTFNDVAGYGFFRDQHWNPKNGTFKHVDLTLFIDRYHASSGLLNNTDQGASLDLVTRSLWELQANSGAAYALVGTTFTPLTQNGETLTYHSGTSTPTQMEYASGTYGNGRLDSWYRNTTFKIAKGATMTLEADDTRQYLTNGTQNVQWLERGSVDFQTGPDSSFDVGIRRFVGTPPTPNGGGICGTVSNPYLVNNPNFIPEVCSNVSFAYHRKFGKRELYVAYGDPSQLFTTPQFLIKVIDYVGADKGT